MILRLAEKKASIKTNPVLGLFWLEEGGGAFTVSKVANIGGEGNLKIVISSEKNVVPTFNQKDRRKGRDRRICTANEGKIAARSDYREGEACGPREKACYFKIGRLGGKWAKETVLCALSRGLFVFLPESRSILGKKEEQSDLKAGRGRRGNEEEEEGRKSFFQTSMRTGKRVGAFLA